jgi:hypothetical protein
MRINGEGLSDFERMAEELWQECLQELALTDKRG